MMRPSLEPTLASRIFPATAGPALVGMRDLARLRGDKNWESCRFCGLQNFKHVFNGAIFRHTRSKDAPVFPQWAQHVILRICKQKGSIRGRISWFVFQMLNSAAGASKWLGR
jgi:hypothetical protein